MDIINTKVVNQGIYCLNEFILRGRPQTNLNASADSGASTITVFNIKGFSEGNYYVAINPGNGNAEIVKMHASTAPSVNTIILATTLANNHNANEPVYFIRYNQIEFSNSATAGGTKSTTGLGNKDIQIDKLWTICPDNTNSSGYAFARFYASDGGAYSNYSAAAPYANADFNTVEYLINETLAEAKLKFTENLTTDYLIKQINECLRDIRRYKNKLSWAQSFNAILGQTSQGQFRFSAPSDIYDKYSFKAIDAIRIGGEPALIKVDPNYFFNRLMANIHFTQVRTTGAVGAITLEIDNSYDFDDSGSITVGSQTITYTGVTRSATAGVLTGVPASGTGAIATQIEVDDWVFQGETSSEPKYWTMFNGYIYIYPLPSSTWDNFNLNCDYFKTITSVDSLDDAVDYIQFDLIKYWLKWKSKAMEKNDGELNLQDSDYLLYRDGLKLMIKKDRDLNVKGFRNSYEFGSKEVIDENPKRIRNSSMI